MRLGMPEQYRPPRYQPPPSWGPREELHFAVEQWDDEGHIEEVLARVHLILPARATFEAIVDARPTQRLTLRHGTRVIDSHDPAKKNPPPVAG
jgi:hypothetical protein